MFLIHNTNPILESTHKKKPFVYIGKCAQSTMTLKGIFSMHTDLPICEELIYFNARQVSIQTNFPGRTFREITSPECYWCSYQRSLKCYPRHMHPTCDVRTSMNSNIFLLNLARVGLRPVGHGLYIKDNINAFKKEDLNKTDDCFEAIWVEIKIDKAKNMWVCI